MKKIKNNILKSLITLFVLSVFPCFFTSCEDDNISAMDFELIYFDPSDSQDEIDKIPFPTDTVRWNK